MRAVTDEYDDFYGPSGSAAAQRSDDDEEEEVKPSAPAPAASSTTAVAAIEDPKKERLPTNFDEESFIWGSQRNSSHAVLVANSLREHSCCALFSSLQVNC